MKKFIYLVPLFIIPLFFNDNNIDVVFEDEKKEVIFYYKDDLLVGELLEANSINEMFNLMSINSNTSTNQTNLCLNNTLYDYYIKENDLYLYSNINESNKALKQIYMTFLYKGFSDVYYNDVHLNYLINPIGSGNYKLRKVSVENEIYIINDYLTNEYDINNILKFFKDDIIEYKIDENIEIVISNEESLDIIYKTFKLNTNSYVNIMVKKQ